LTGAPRANHQHKLLLIVTVLLSGTAGLLILEYGIRWLVPAYDPSGHVRFVQLYPDVPALGEPLTTQRQIKNTGDYDVTVTFNRHGFRDVKDLTRGTVDDWYVVGDSYCFGWGVAEQERYSNILETILGRSVYNLCAPADFRGYAQILAYARRAGAPVKKLLVGVCLENDVHGFYDRQEAPLPGAAERNINDVKRGLAQTSALYVLATTLIHQSTAFANWAERWGLPVTIQPAPAAFRYQAKVLEMSLGALSPLLHVPGVAVLVTPSRFLWVGSRTAEERHMHERFVQALKERGAQVVDPLSAMERSGDPLALHFPNDGHWNARGHRLVADVLARSLGSVSP
jgi:hypothetical protein